MHHRACLDMGHSFCRRAVQTMLSQFFALKRSLGWDTAGGLSFEPAGDPVLLREGAGDHHCKRMIGSFGSPSQYARAGKGDCQSDPDSASRIYP